MDIINSFEEEIQSKNIFYSLLYLTPMIIMYELLCAFQYFGETFVIRNSADVFIRNIFWNIFYSF